MDIKRLRNLDESEKADIVLCFVLCAAQQLFVDLSNLTPGEPEPPLAENPAGQSGQDAADGANSRQEEGASQVAGEGVDVACAPAAESVSADIQALQYLSKAVGTSSSFAEMTELLASAKSIVCTGIGKSGLVAQRAAATFRSIGLQAR